MAGGPQASNPPEEFGFKSTVNSSTKKLGSGATFTGEWERNDSADVMVSCQTDNTGTLYFDFSNDGVNVSTFPVSGFTIASGIHEFHTAVKGPRYFRVRLVNDTGAQTYLRLYTYYGNFRQPSAPLNQPLGLDADAILVRPSFDWLDLSRGLTTGMDGVKKFGASINIGSTYTPVCWGEVYQTPTSAVSLEFVSGSADDALDSTGAHEVTVIGIDANWDLQTVSTAAHATDGTTAVAISGTWLRVFRAYVSKSGTYATATSGSHAGAITIRVASAGATYAVIPLDTGNSNFPMGQSLIGAYSVPRNYTAHIFITDISVDTGKTVDMAYFVRENADDVTGDTYDGVMQTKSIYRGINGIPFNRTGDQVPLVVNGPADVGFLAAGASTPEVGVEFEVFLVNE